MKTFEINQPVTAAALNESLHKQFNVRINFDKYTRAQLEDYRNILRTKVHQLEGEANFNDLLTNENYQRDKFVLGVLNTKIKEMLGEAKLAEKMKSQQQSKLMHAAAADPDVAKKTGVSQKVAKEFVKKSHGQKVGNLPKKVKKPNESQLDELSPGVLGRAGLKAFALAGELGDKINQTC